MDDWRTNHQQNPQQNQRSIVDNSDVYKGIGYKPGYTFDGEPCIIVISIPDNAKKTDLHEKVRTNTMYVLDIHLVEHPERHVSLALPMLSKETIVYEQNCIYEIDEFDDNDSMCGSGFHFYNRKDEAMIALGAPYSDPIWDFGNNYREFPRSHLRCIREWLLVQKRLVPHMPAEVTHYIIELVVSL